MTLGPPRRAVREQVPLFIGLSAGTGAGKTLSALKLATGIAGRDKPFAVIETEAGRSRHYAPLENEKPDFINTFNFEVLELDAPYSSERYREAIIACKAYPCIVVDQASFEHVGPGGHLERHSDIVQERVERAKKRQGENRADWQLEEAFNMTAWKVVKHERKMLIMDLIAVRVPVIFCFRAEEKMEMKETKDDRGNKKTIIIAAKDRPLKERWQPICGKEFEPEMLAFFLLVRDKLNADGDKRGIPIPLKLNAQHTGFVDLEKPLDEAAGKLFAAWASGTKSEPPAAKSASLPPPPGDAGGSDPKTLIERADEAVSYGSKAYEEFWIRLTPADRKTIGIAQHDILKSRAQRMGA